jgi:hypothetical protein
MGRYETFTFSAPLYFVLLGNGMLRASPGSRLHPKPVNNSFILK